MARLAKYLAILIFFAAVALVAYAYVGPWFGADFSAPAGDVRKPVVLNAD